MTAALGIEGDASYKGTAMRSWTLFMACVIGAPLSAQEVRFNRDIRPILSENCFFCHGPDSARRKAGLRLDTKEGLFTERDGERPFVPGLPGKSSAYLRIVSNDSAEIMPPVNSHKRLTAKQKDVVKRWIEQGAEWEPHWSFAMPVRPPVPAVKDEKWVRNPIDAFIRQRLEQAALTPAVEADRRTLARRLSLDLRGLPPAPEEVEAFVSDTSANAYEKLVDRFLASEHYGEHRARYWLDAARYADTHGLHFDNYREMWPYRDWVIAAFNRNQPFDQFTLEQIAGDLLKGRTNDQLIATGFHRCNVTTNEGGTIPEENLALYARDRVETTATVWLGLTAGCAQCHNHPYDPLSQKEFYQFAAFFRNTTQEAMDGNIPDTPPILVVPAEADRPRWEKLRTRSAELRAELQGLRDASGQSLAAWIQSGAAAEMKEPLDPSSQSFALADFTDALPKTLTRGEGNVKGSDAVYFTGKESLVVDRGVDFDADRAFSLSAWVYVPKQEGNFTIASQTGADAKDKGRGWRLTLGNRILAFSFLADGGKAITRSAGSVRLKGGSWAHVVVLYDGSRKSSGIRWIIDGKSLLSSQAPDQNIDGSIRVRSPLKLGDLDGGALSDVRIFDRQVSPDEASVLLAWNSVRAELDRSAARPETKYMSALMTLHLLRTHGGFQKASQELARADEEMQAIRHRGAVTHVINEKLETMPIANVLFRGQYDQPGEEVKAAVFAALHPMPQDAPANRLGLARWLVSPDNPLTARVTVNRFWQEIFGVGIVKTSEDFGIMGENPSHPHLLDWLAVEFRDSGWDVKKLIKLIVTSSTYRQAATVTPEKLEKDPANRLLSRGARFRMDAEMIRDYALASSGLLVRKIGGPSVKPYQPDGVWEAVAMIGSNTRHYQQDSGERLYRRSLYTFWKRGAPPAAMDILNAPSRELCSVRRERTNTPLQALVTMNDPQFIEAARHLAQLTLRKGGVSVSSRLDFMATRLLARPFRSEERAIVGSTLGDLLAHYKSAPEEARKLLAVGESKADSSLDASELAAWTMLGNQLLNLDEVLNR
jgi:hypothetical protein